MSDTQELLRLRKAISHASEDLAELAESIPLPDPDDRPQPPVAVGDNIKVRAGETASFEPMANDLPGDAPLQSFRVLGEPTKGRISIAGNQMSYTAGDNTRGFDSFDYIVVDALNQTSQPATVSIRIRPVSAEPSEPTPAQHRRRLIGMAPVASQSPAGGPCDSMAALMTRLEPGLLAGTGRKFDLVSIFGLIDKRILLKPGRGYKANLYPQMTDRGQVALITMPILWRQEPKDAGGPGDFDSVLNNRFDEDYEAFFEHLKESGQTQARLRLGHEGDLRGAFPWGVNYDWHGLGNAANFQRQRGALKHVRDIAKRVLPDCMIVSCHYWQPQVKVQGVTHYIDPDGCMLALADADAIGVDWYDGHGKAMDNQAVWDREADLAGPDGQPWGLRKWAAYAKSKDKPFCVDEWGLMIRPDMTQDEKLQRDNPFFISKMWEFYQTQGQDLAHMAYFHLGNSTSRLVPETQAGTRRATDEWLRTFGQATA